MQNPADTTWRPRWWSGPDPDRKEYFCQVGPDTFIHVWRYTYWAWREWAWNVHRLMSGHDLDGHRCYSTQTGNATSKRSALKRAMQAVEISQEHSER